MAQVTIALNGRIIEERDTTLETLKSEWAGLTEDSGRGFDFQLYFSSAMQIVWKDRLYGSVLTAWVNNPSDCVSFQVLEMG